MSINDIIYLIDIYFNFNEKTLMKTYKSQQKYVFNIIPSDINSKHHQYNITINNQKLINNFNYYDDSNIQSVIKVAKNIIKNLTKFDKYFSLSNGFKSLSKDKDKDIFARKYLYKKTNKLIVVYVISGIIEIYQKKEDETIKKYLCDLVLKYSGYKNVNKKYTFNEVIEYIKNLNINHLYGIY